MAGEVNYTPVIIYAEYLEDIADAIRAKRNVNLTFTPAEMPAAIAAISTSSGWTSTTLTVIPEANITRSKFGNDVDLSSYTNSPFLFMCLAGYNDNGVAINGDELDVIVWYNGSTYTWLLNNQYAGVSNYSITNNVFEHSTANTNGLRNTKYYIIKGS